jgi:[FeFe] hydrogenase H-cluster maturation GTPase HydF
MAAELNQTPSANRIHIGFYGLRNAGKSSLVNKVTNQNLAIVSDVKGTTTDPVTKAMELLPLGPVVIIDTPGLDDEGELGALRVKKAYQALNKTDIAVLVVDASKGMSDEDYAILGQIKTKNIPYIIALNKTDLANGDAIGFREGEGLVPGDNVIRVSSLKGENIDELRNLIASKAKVDSNKRIIGDKLKEGDMVVLVCPIDESAPKGRMILPQVQAIRDILDEHAMCVVTQTDELPKVLESFKNPPKIVVTDSQDFGKVKNMVPDDIMLTSFSILMANYKGILETAVKGAASVKDLKDGDTVLISEGCTHHRQCKDIGTVKLPGWIENFTNKKINFEFTQGGEYPEDLSKYALIVHCGGCMLPEREMMYRLKCAEDEGVAFTNYGTLIAYMNGILGRSLQIFPSIADKCV